MQPLSELMMLALEEGVERARRDKEPPETLAPTVALATMDVALAMLVRHPRWTRRLGALHAVLVDGKAFDGAKLDALVERFPLEGWRDGPTPKEK